uniref:Uncharacterized protein n=1 Tax=Sphaerodactylus townsendi TaxID=933632 RepID=A0ACB8ESA0_9SAUR
MASSPLPHLAALAPCVPLGDDGEGEEVPLRVSLELLLHCQSEGFACRDCTRCLTSPPLPCISLTRSSLNKDFRDHAEQQHIAAQQKAALQHAHAHSSGYFITQDSAFGNLILPVLPRLDVE